MTNHSEATFDSTSFGDRSAAGVAVPTLINREDLQDVTIMTIRWQGTWTVVSTSHVEDRLIDPQGEVHDIYAAQGRPNLPTDAHLLVASASEFFALHS